MRELPIIFSAPMVRAILEGRKTVTRQVAKLPPAPSRLGQWEATTVGGTGCVDRRGNAVPEVPAVWHTRTGQCFCAAYQIGDRLFVREAWQPGYDHEPDYDEPKVSVIYKADDAELTVAAPSYELADEWDLRYSEDGDRPPRVRAPASMPKWAARIWLEVTEVRVERLQDITADQEIAEGMVSHLREHDAVVDLRQQFADLWDGLAKPGTTWADNPWVWVVEFRRVEVPRADQA